jgi:hypothetical protein
MASFDTFRGQARPAFGRERTWERARTLALSALVGLGRRTVTGMLSASGQIGMDWSAALPEGNGSHRARGIPIDLTHCPLPKKPWRNAPPPAWEEYGDLQKTMKVSAVGVDRIKALRASMNTDSENVHRPLILAVDGSFTNKTVFRDLPPNTTFVGRIRKDARLFLPPTPSDRPRRGRRRWYGNPLPTPEQIRQDPIIPWVTVPAWGAGEIHRFEVKTFSPVRWAGSGRKDVRLVVIRPLAYRPRRRARLLYRDPVYLLCADPDLPLGQLLQSFLWRWEIEMRFRDGKTVLGVGEAQVRTKIAVETVPCFIVAAYAFLLLSYADVGKGRIGLPMPKWRRVASGERDSTPRLIGALRSQLWGRALGVNLSHFVDRREGKTNAGKIGDGLPSAVCYAFR